MDKHIQAAAATPCPYCRGRGTHVERKWGGSGMMSGEFTCLACGGTGKVGQPNATAAVRAWLASVGRSADELDQTVNHLWKSVTDHRPDWATMGAAATYLSEMAEAIRAVE